MIVRKNSLTWDDPLNIFCAADVPQETDHFYPDHVVVHYSQSY